MRLADADAWFARHTARAPEALRRRAEHFFRAATGELAARLSAAGGIALGAATRAPADRAAALDLLAADALITLALLHAAETDAAGLGAVATRLRTEAAS